MQSSKVTDSGEEYSGRENLEDMKDAVNYNAFLQDLVRQHALDTASVLDFGAGIGTFTRSVPVSPSNISCVEPDLRAQAELRKAGYSVFSDLSETEPDGYTFVFSLNVLEHIEDDQSVVNDLYARLKSGGRVFIYVPAHNHIRTKMDDLVGHHRRYSRQVLVRLFEEAGFEVEYARYTDVLGYFATWLVKLQEVFKKDSTGHLNNTALIVYDRIAFPVSRLLSPLFGRWFGKNLLLSARKS